MTERKMSFKRFQRSEYAAEIQEGTVIRGPYMRQYLEIPPAEPCYLVQFEGESCPDLVLAEDAVQ